jgi:hypothetical protein
MNGKEKIILSSEEIMMDGCTNGDRVMHIGELSLMQKLANIVTQNGGDILEIGFGMHLSADEIQSNPNVTSHTIIEVHPEIYQNALEWCKDKPNTKIILGDWIDILPTLDSKFDGILHDTHLDSNIPKFLDYVKPNCKKGTIVAFFWAPMVDSIFNAIRYELAETEYESLPYKNSYFKYGDYELKYTTFNGKEFSKEKNIQNLI